METIYPIFPYSIQVFAFIFTIFAVEQFEGLLPRY